MNSARHDIQCDQGSVFGLTVMIYANAAETELFDLTGYSARLRIAKSYESQESLIELEDGDGLTITDPTDGEIAIRLEPEQTAALPASMATSGSSLVWSLELIDGDGVVEEKLWGSFDVKPRVPA